MTIAGLVTILFLWFAPISPIDHQQPNVTIENPINWLEPPIQPV